MPRVARAIEQLRGPEGADAERIIRRVNESATRQQESHPTELDGLVRDAVTDVRVPSPGLTHFDSFLTSAISVPSLGERQNRIYLPRGLLGRIRMSYFGKSVDRSSRLLSSFISFGGTLMPIG